jgi:hypothetical protein
MSVYRRILIALLQESKKSEKNLDEIDPANISEDLVVELIKTKDNQNVAGVKYTVEKVGKDKAGKHLFKLSRPGFEKVITFEELSKNYKRS